MDKRVAQHSLNVNETEILNFIDKMSIYGGDFNKETNEKQIIANKNLDLWIEKNFLPNKQLISIFEQSWDNDPGFQTMKNLLSDNNKKYLDFLLLYTSVKHPTKLLKARLRNIKILKATFLLICLVIIIISTKFNSIIFFIIGIAIVAIGRFMMKVFSVYTTQVTQKYTHLIMMGSAMVASNTVPDQFIQVLDQLREKSSQDMQK